jgi:hypothetical protein
VQRFDLFEKRGWRYDDPAFASHNFVLMQVLSKGINHRYHNAAWVLLKREGRWWVVHVHEPPASWPQHEKSKNCVKCDLCVSIRVNVGLTLETKSC